MRRQICVSAMILIFAVANGPETATAYPAQKKAGSRAKSRKKDSKTPNVRTIDVRAQKALDTFVREAAAAAREYEEAGELDKAKLMLRSIMKINPNLKGVKDKIKQLDETQLGSNLTDFTIDVRRGWDKPLVRVFKGRPIRIRAEGQYKFITSLSVGPAGFPTRDPVKGDMVKGVPAGALIGIVAFRAKRGKPFAIGAGLEFTPKEDGLLYLNVNAPPKHRSTGKIKIKISGIVARP